MTSRTPSIFTTMLSSVRRPVFCSKVRRVHAAAAARFSVSPAPVANAELNISDSCGAVVLPSSRVHEGMSTSESRGMDTRSTRLRSAERCTSTVVSDRMPSSSPASAAFSPSRLSVPMTRMFSG